MKSFLSGRRTADASGLRSLQSASLAACLSRSAPPAEPPAPAGVSVECVKQGDKVMRLIVTCACGQRVEIDCLYPAAG